MSEENTKRKKGSPLLLILLIASLIGNGYFLMKSFEAKEEIKGKQIKIDTLLDMQFKIASELYSTGQELITYKGIAGNLDSLLAIADKKIGEQKEKISNLFKQNLSMKSLREKLNKEMALLRQFRDIYLDKVDSLMITNKTLQEENMQLH